jgi:DNA-binding CsgD family transcriptional regulator
MSGDPTETLHTHVHAGRRARVRVVVVSGPDEGAAYEIGETVCVLGRDATADVVLRGEGVSRHHAKLIADHEGGVQVIDLGAKNGTWLNGTQVKAALLQHGDTLQVGRVVLRYERAAAVTTVRTDAEGELTARELEIGRLVARGLTNAEIGGVLGISRATVATHLQRAYKRLGLSSRAELATLIASRES